MAEQFLFSLTYKLLLLSYNLKATMKSFFLLILIMYCYFSQAQNIELYDTRSKKESFTKVPQKDIRADLATFTMGGIYESVGKEQLRKISFTSFSSDSMTFEGDGIKATVATAPFDAAMHKLLYDEKYLVKIDRKTYHGNYGSLPKKHISRVTVIMGKDTVGIPVAAYSDLYNLNLAYLDKSGTQRSANGIYLSNDGRKIYLYLLCKDNTGSYEVTWVIQDKKYLRRVVDYGFM
jgi:hypothetical protein